MALTPQQLEQQGYTKQIKGGRVVYSAPKERYISTRNKKLKNPDQYRKYSKHKVSFDKQGKILSESNIKLVRRSGYYYQKPVAHEVTRYENGREIKEIRGYKEGSSRVVTKRRYEDGKLAYNRGREKRTYATFDKETGRSVTYDRGGNRVGYTQPKDTDEQKPVDNTARPVGWDRMTREQQRRWLVDRGIVQEYDKDDFKAYEDRYKTAQEQQRQREQMSALETPRSQGSKDAENYYLSGQTQKPYGESSVVVTNVPREKSDYEKAFNIMFKKPLKKYAKGESIAKKYIVPAYVSTKNKLIDLVPEKQILDFVPQGLKDTIRTKTSDYYTTNVSEPLQKTKAIKDNLQQQSSIEPNTSLNIGFRKTIDVLDTGSQKLVGAVKEIPKYTDTRDVAKASIFIGEMYALNKGFQLIGMGGSAVRSATKGTKAVTYLTTRSGKVGGVLKFATNTAINTPTYLAQSYGTKALGEYYIDNISLNTEESKLGEKYKDIDTNRMYQLANQQKDFAYVDAGGNWFTKGVRTIQTELAPWSVGNEVFDASIRQQATEQGLDADEISLLMAKKRTGRDILQTYRILQPEAWANVEGSTTTNQLLAKTPLSKLKKMSWGQRGMKWAGTKLEPGFVEGAVATNVALDRYGAFKTQVAGIDIDFKDNLKQRAVATVGGGLFGSFSASGLGYLEGVALPSKAGSFAVGTLGYLSDAPEYPGDVFTGTIVGGRSVYTQNFIPTLSLSTTKTKQRTQQKQELFTNNKDMLKSFNTIKVKQGTKTKQKTKALQREDTFQPFKSKQQQKQDSFVKQDIPALSQQNIPALSQQDIGTLQKQDTFVKQDTKQDSFVKQDQDTFTNVMTGNFPFFWPGGGDGTLAGKGGKSRSRRKYGYQAGFEAKVRGIYGKAPKGVAGLFTGAEFRPILGSPPKKKKKKTGFTAFSLGSFKFKGGLKI